VHKKIAIVIITVLMLLLVGCSGSENNSKSGVPSNSSTTSSNNSETNNTNDNTVATDDKVEEAFEDFKDGKPARMSGNSSKEFRITMEEGGYYLRMKTKDLWNGLIDVSIKSATSGYGVTMYSRLSSGKDEDGWHVYERIEHMYSTDENIFVVEAEGPYIIEIHKLPLSSGNKDLPLKFKGSGTMAVGPVASEGSITLKAKTADAKQAGFVINVMDATTGETTNIAYMNVDLETKAVTNEIDITETVDLAGPGSYFFHVTANMDCEWELELSK